MNIIGDKNLFAVQYKILDQSQIMDPEAYACIWVKGVQIGTLDDFCYLYDTYKIIRRIASLKQDDYLPEFFMFTEPKKMHRLFNPEKGDKLGNKIADKTFKFNLIFSPCYDDFDFVAYRKDDYCYLLWKLFDGRTNYNYPNYEHKIYLEEIKHSIILEIFNAFKVEIEVFDR